ncbi:peptidylprolyl isomerase [Acuticoccus yangtzensis]|uniref:peptidylprolyl isomerase n=1 Tax=Acuticoccus yangtzensis TaxID=1443441 RepID=UPI00094951E9|nr:peptidylprolyl isomerase [Acuticoccus yangtzensis]ORE91934.1 PpiC-type peptidyl-prolyl cis-trans isomerase [Stappia sp. 22II-S9-Z10]
MIKRTLSAMAASAFLVSAAFAQNNPAADQVLATVNGDEITAGDVTYARAALGDAVQRMPADQRDEMILSLLIDMALMADAAEKEGLDQDPDFQRRMAFQRMQALQEGYMTGVVAGTITEEAVKSRYDEEVAKLPKEQLSASHILVETEEEAKDLIAQLNDGADFAKLAEEHSKDPGSAARGGSLGNFTRGRMVKPFEDAAFALEVGEITEEPVQSQFGWHIIKLDEKSEVPVPPLEQVAGQIQQLLVRDAYVSAVEALKADADIETAGGVPLPNPATTPAETNAVPAPPVDPNAPVPAPQ